MRAVLFLAAASLGRGAAFNLPGLTNIFQPPAPTSAAGGGKKLASEESQLLAAISNTGNGKDADLATQARVLSLVRKMETASPPSPTLLSNVDEAKSMLDGDWYLQYTAPSEIDVDSEGDDKWVAVDAAEGDANIETRQFGTAGSVSGGGIPVDASSDPALQSFDIDNSRVTNKIMAGIGQVTVGGGFRQSSKVPLRAVVGFDTAKIALNVGPTIDISFLFDIRAAIKGTFDAGWLEVTYISDNLRIGRGNKGSLFILTREKDVNV
ncbi:hypothetical protein ACHAXT_003245 [Thalassiosira profunda]